jgi:hypothetical protein
MGDYYTEFGDTVTRDELQAATPEPIEIHNIKVANNAKIKRGMLLAATNATSVFSAATAADTSKYLAIAYTDFDADADHTVTQAYVSGAFHREKIIDGTDDYSVTDALENTLRMQNIRVVSLKDLYGHYDKWAQ